MRFGRGGVTAAVGVQAMNRFIAFSSRGVPALVLAATLSLPSGAVVAAPTMTAALQEQAEFLCERTEFTRREIRRLQRSRDLPLILTYALQVCPNVAAVLSDGATASTGAPLPPRDNDNDRAPADRPEKESPKGI
ncbi:MAG: hypothetical protein B7Z02_00355 [Rhodobacterales bacterium 32-67-9]|nr:MAG: hypothetical protein B7Z02_00355 [Rhodobacterales bacterium 32-67-9]